MGVERDVAAVKTRGSKDEGVCGLGPRRLARDDNGGIKAEGYPGVPCKEGPKANGCKWVGIRLPGTTGKAFAVGRRGSAAGVVT